MPKVRGPLFSLKAAGTLCGTLTYKKAAAGNVVRKNRKPKYTRNAAQATVRTWFQRGVWTWQGNSGLHGYAFSYLSYGLEEPARQAWRGFRTTNNSFGYYAFMKRWIQRSLQGVFQYQVPPNFGFCVADEWLANFLYANGRFHDWVSGLPPIPPVAQTQYVAGIVALWHMDESEWDGTAGEVIDSSGNNNDGTITGTPNTVPGKFDRSGDFSGTPERINITNSVSIDIVTGQVTYLIWVKRNSIGATMVMFDKNSVTPEPIYLGIMPSNKIYLQIFYTASHYWFANTVATFTDTDWHLIGAVCNYTDWSESKIYVDGLIESVVPVQNGSEQDLSNSGNLTIAATNSGGSGMDGILDEAAIVNREIPAAEMLEIYNNNLPYRITP